MKTIEDEVIGKLRYLTIEFDQTELLAGHIGIISQGAVRRYFEGECPDLKVMKCGGLKLDSQRSIVTMRFGIVNNQPEKLVGIPSFIADTAPGYGGSLKSIAEDINPVAASDSTPGDSAYPKLLNPGYDEILLENKKLKEKYDYLIEKYQITGNKLSEVYKKYDVLQHEKDIVGRLYDALVVAVSKDAQKFSDLLVENEKLKIELMQYMKTDKPSVTEDAADLADAKEVIESADSVPLSEVEVSPCSGCDKSDCGNAQEPEESENV